MTRNDLGPVAVDRRDFLKLGDGILVFVSLSDPSLLRATLEQQRGYPTDFNAYLTGACSSGTTTSTWRGRAARSSSTTCTTGPW